MHAPVLRVLEIGHATRAGASDASTGERTGELHSFVNIELANSIIATGWAADSLPAIDDLEPLLGRIADAYIDMQSWETAFGHHARARRILSQSDSDPSALTLACSGIDKAVLDAVLKACGMGFCEGMSQNIAGVPALGAESFDAEQLKLYSDKSRTTTAWPSAHASGSMTPWTKPQWAAADFEPESKRSPEFARFLAELCIDDANLGTISAHACASRSTSHFRTSSQEEEVPRTMVHAAPRAGAAGQTTNGPGADCLPSLPNLDEEQIPRAIEVSSPHLTGSSSVGSRLGNCLNFYDAIVLALRAGHAVRDVISMERLVCDDLRSRQDLIAECFMALCSDKCGSALMSSAVRSLTRNAYMESFVVAPGFASAGLSVPASLHWLD